MWSDTFHIQLYLADILASNHKSSHGIFLCTDPFTIHFHILFEHMIDTHVDCINVIMQASFIFRKVINYFCKIGVFI